MKFVLTAVGLRVPPWKFRMPTVPADAALRVTARALIVPPTPRLATPVAAAPALLLLWPSRSPVLPSVLPALRTPVPDTFSTPVPSSPIRRNVVVVVWLNDPPLTVSTPKLPGNRQTPGNPPLVADAVPLTVMIPRANAPIWMWL